MTWEEFLNILSVLIDSHGRIKQTSCWIYKYMYVCMRICVASGWCVYMCGGSDLWWPAGQVFGVAGCNSEYAFWVSFVRKLQGIIHPFSDNSFTLFNQMLVTVCLTCQCHVYTHSLTHTYTCILTHTLTLSHTHTHTLTAPTEAQQAALVKINLHNTSFKGLVLQRNRPVAVDCLHWRPGSWIAYHR